MLHRRASAIPPRTARAPPGIEIPGYGRAPSGRGAEHLLALIRKRGGQITARTLMRSSRAYKAADQAHAALATLVSARLATKQAQPARKEGGRRTEVFEAASPVA